MRTALAAFALGLVAVVIGGPETAATAAGSAPAPDPIAGLAAGLENLPLDDILPEPPPAHPDPVDHAIEDLAELTGSDPADIDVVAYDDVTWRDSSLGCPQPNEMYAQALTEGYRIVLRAEGEEHHYHGADGEEPFRCENPDPNGTVDG